MNLIYKYILSSLSLLIFFFTIFLGLSFKGSEINKSDSFDSLGGDSLSYVTLSVELEVMLGSCFTPDWSSQSIQDLELLHQKKLFFESQD